MIRYIDRFEAITGDFSSAADYLAFWSPSQNVTLLSAWAVSSNVVTTGTVEITLRLAQVGGSSGGRKVGKALDNFLLDAEGAVFQRRKFDLKDDAGMTIAANSIMFLGRSSTNSADRFDNPGMILEIFEP